MYLIEMEYLIRIDVIGDESVFRTKVVEWVSSKGKSIGCYEYHAGNHHYHVWLRSDCKLQALRASFKKSFPECVGNKSYSISQKAGNLNYVCKGPEAPDVRSGPIIIVNDMCSVDEVAIAHDQYWVDLKGYKDKVCSKSGDGDGPKKTAKLLDLIEARVDEWLKNNPQRDPGRITRREWIKILVEQFAFLRKLWDTPVITKYANWFEYKYRWNDHISALVEACENRY